MFVDRDKNITLPGGYFKVKHSFFEQYLEIFYL